MTRVKALAHVVMQAALLGVFRIMIDPFSKEIGVGSDLKKASTLPNENHLKFLISTTSFVVVERAMTSCLPSRDQANDGMK